MHGCDGIGVEVKLDLPSLAWLHRGPGVCFRCRADWGMTAFCRGGHAPPGWCRTIGMVMVMVVVVCGSWHVILMGDWPGGLTGCISRTGWSLLVPLRSCGPGLACSGRADADVAPVSRIYAEATNSVLGRAALRMTLWSDTRSGCHLLWTPHRTPARRSDVGRRGRRLGRRAFAGG